MRVRLKKRRMTKLETNIRITVEENIAGRKAETL